MAVDGSTVIVAVLELFAGIVSPFEIVTVAVFGNCPLMASGAAAHTRSVSKRAREIVGDMPAEAAETA